MSKLTPKQARDRMKKAILTGGTPAAGGAPPRRLIHEGVNDRAQSPSQFLFRSMSTA
jgi:hypothetical protein